MGSRNSYSPPLNTWWVNEHFDMSMSLGNQATVQIRFVLTDVINGLAGRYGWLLMIFVLLLHLVN